MRKRSWNYYFTLAAGFHILLIGLAMLLGLDWLKEEPEEQPSIEIGFVGDAAAAGLAGGSAGNSGKQAALGPDIKTVSVAAVEELQNLRGHTPADKSEAAVKPPAADSAEAIEKAVAALDSPGPATGCAGADADAGAGASGASGTTSEGTGGTGGNGTGTSQGLGAGFTPNGDGTYTAASSAGISYQLLRDAEAIYPDEATSIGYSNAVEVVAQIMVGLDGSVESVTILNNPPNLGFREAAQEALWSMRFAPIYYQGVNVRVPFEKHLIFQP
ncbi:outer membrane transport energization protein TonB [Selenomonas sp. WCT3]|uniref:energy transducer TonB n=1 Tax=Selenomonas sp. WCT3 TaxID=3158785 RepID=UPI000882E627|nr:outer membrane transport energization protein TonB [Selenomonas ruminantium]